jgi:general secretion pathway protein L
MSVLVIQIPLRSRQAKPAEPAAEFDYVFSHDGQAVTATGRATPAALPRADAVLAVLADADVAWHRITLPKAPGARLRAALGGVLEDALLDDNDDLHLALAPQAAAGQPTWVAAVHKGWLAATLATLEAGGATVERVVPAAAPGDAASGHFHIEQPADDAPTLALAHADGAVSVRLNGTLARALLPPEGTPVRWTATPAAAAAAERWLGAPVSVLTEPERQLQAARSAWNLRQFDLAARHRGMRALRDAARRLLSPEWRWVRYGAAALVVLQLVGLNAAAWQQRRQMADKRTTMASLLQASHPGVRLVYDAPVQMERETDLLRAAAGRPGDGDLEALLGAAAAAWPDGQGPVQTLRFETGRLTLAAPGWGEQQLAQFRDRLRAAGLQVELADGRLTVSRSAKGLG